MLRSMQILRTSVKLILEYFRILIIALLFKSLEPVRLFVFLKEQCYIHQGCINLIIIIIIIIKEILQNIITIQNNCFYFILFNVM